MAHPHTPNSDPPDFGFWMLEVLRQCDLAAVDFASDPVHDLRVALRRCRSLADGFVSFDPSPEWRQMKRAGKVLFADLGALRDIQVMAEWVGKLADPADSSHPNLGDDPVVAALLQHCAEREQQLKTEAHTALVAFDRKQWARWADSLPPRAASVPLDDALFQHLALERWQEARQLHHAALRNRSNIALHALRIGLKRLRYTVENFLPSLYQLWGKGLKDAQDQLGDVHDLDVLWATLVRIRAFADAPARLRWRKKITAYRQLRIARYRETMVGPDSRWNQWRKMLPPPEQWSALGLQRLAIWAGFLDSDAAHTRLVNQLALQLYDGLAGDSFVRRNRNYSNRTVLQAAVLLHETGRARRSKQHHKLAPRMALKFPLPLGWSIEELRLAGLVARYHRGALPAARHRGFAALTPAKQRTAAALAGILRLADALDRDHAGRVRGIEVEDRSEFVVLWAQGYDPAISGLRVAAARHLLETVWARPVFVRPLAEKVT